MDREIDTIRKKMVKNVNIDYLVSRGEYLTGLCLAEYLEADFIDAKELILFDYNGKVNFEKSKKALEARINKERKLLFPDFTVLFPMRK